MEQRITRAKSRVGQARRALRDTGSARAASALAAVAAIIYLIFNEGYSATGGEAHIRAPLCEEAIRLAACCCACFRPSPRSWA